MPNNDGGVEGLKSSILNAIYPRQEVLQHSTTHHLGGLDDDSETPALDAVAKEMTNVNLHEEASSKDKDKEATCVVAAPEPIKPSVSTTSAPALVPDKETGRKFLSVCRRGQLDECSKLLKQNPQLVNYVSPFHYNYTPIHVAARARQHKILQILTDYKADLNAPTLSGYTALHLAAQTNDKETINILRALGADETIHDFFGQPYTNYLTSRENDVLGTSSLSSGGGSRLDTLSAREFGSASLSSYSDRVSMNSSSDLMTPTSSSATTNSFGTSSSSHSSFGRKRDVIRDLLKISHESKF